MRARRELRTRSRTRPSHRLQKFRVLVTDTPLNTNSCLDFSASRLPRVGGALEAAELSCLLTAGLTFSLRIYRGTSLTGTRTPLGPYCRPLARTNTCAPPCCPTILGLTFWACGTNPSFLARTQAKAHITLGRPKRPTGERVGAFTRREERQDLRMLRERRI